MTKLWHKLPPSIIIKTKKNRIGVLSVGVTMRLLMCQRNGFAFMMSLVSSLLLAQDIPKNSWTEEEKAIKEHLDALTTQQHDLSTEIGALNEQLFQSQKTIQDLKNSLELLQDSQGEQKKLLGKQLQQALKWELKNQASQQLMDFSSQRSVKDHLLAKLLQQQKQQLKEQLEIIKAFDLQIQEQLQSEQTLKEKIGDREVFFSQLIHNDQQLKSFLAVCLQEQEKEAQFLASQVTQVFEPVSSFFSTEPFQPSLLFVPLPFFSGRHKKDFFGATVISGKEGEPISAVGPGKVIFSDQMKGLGRVVMVEHDDSYLSLYGNCSEINKKIGDQVATGEQIATVGKSGQLGVSALYFEFRHDSQLITPQWDKEKA